MAKKNSKAVYLAAVLLFLGGFGYLIYSGLSEDSVYFLNVNEALAAEEGVLQQARLFGKVAMDNVDPNGGVGVAFDLVDKMKPGQAIRVDYKGSVPDTFKPGVEVIVEGRMDPSAKVFKAKTLVTKCPSKYKEQSEEMEEKA
ncbi:cytochrome c maturation protein CcmE [Salidesulfovibrio brasiliensis]|uniref:cytochrome c maturation protein CcmE n=1 Tax=Salidesulfovibrio brasiliensis TaxID=221711 RepID=UPI0006CFDC54|nr:cytochrome c maturation protein CcmE [Salidesulfovibrio brasiliensis]